MVKVTYLICNHNYGNYIEGALRSAISQTLKCHLAICDDASTDNSVAEILDFLDGEPIIQDYKEYKTYTFGDHLFIQLNNQSGPAHARNLLIQHTLQDTDYYAVLDADDENYPQKIEKCVQIMESNPAVGLVYANYDILNLDTELLLTEFKPRYSYPALLQSCIVHSGFVARKTALHSAVEQSGWYDYRLRTCEDWDLELRISDKWLIYHIPEPLSVVRNHRNNSTFTVDKQIWENNWRIVAEKTHKRHQL